MQSLVKYLQSFQLFYRTLNYDAKARVIKSAKMVVAILTVMNWATNWTQALDNLSYHCCESTCRNPELESQKPFFWLLRVSIQMIQLRWQLGSRNKCKTQTRKSISEFSHAWTMTLNRLAESASNKWISRDLDDRMLQESTAVKGEIIFAACNSIRSDESLIANVRQ